MTRDERLKKYQEAGAEFVEAAATRVGDFLHEVSSAGEATHGKASSTVDDLVGGGKRSTDQLLDAIRREIAAQLRTLGLATTDDLTALERRLTGRVPAGKAAAGTTATRKPGATKTATRKTAARKTAARKTAATKATATKTAATKTASTKAPVTKAAGSTRTAARKAGSSTRATAKKAAGSTRAAATKAASTASDS